MYRPARMGRHPRWEFGAVCDKIAPWASIYAVSSCSTFSPRVMRLCSPSMRSLSLAWAHRIHSSFRSASLAGDELVSNVANAPAVAIPMARLIRDRKDRCRAG